MSKEKVSTESQIAVLIDFENVGLNPIQGLFDQLSDVGRIIIKKAYADWSSNIPREQLFELGIEPVLVLKSTSSAKNSSDIQLTIDAVELIFQSSVDTFVIVSSDKDFVPLITKLRAAGKVVIGAGRKDITPKNLVRSCDKYIYFEQVDLNAVPQKSESPSLDELLERGVKASRDAYGRVFGSKLHSTLQRLDPSFNYQTYGYSTFAKLLEATPVVNVKRPNRVGDVTIELNEPFLESATTPIVSDLAGLINDAWTKRAPDPGKAIAGPVAASDAAKVLKVPKLSLSPYKTLQKLLDTNEYLNKKWKRTKNMIIRLTNTQPDSD